MQNEAMIDCPTCGAPATLTVRPLNDARLTLPREQYVCPNGHTVPVKQTPPNDPRLTRG